MLLRPRGVLRGGDWGTMSGAVVLRWDEIQNKERPLPARGSFVWTLVNMR